MRNQFHKSLRDMYTPCQRWPFAIPQNNMRSFAQLVFGFIKR